RSPARSARRANSGRPTPAARDTTPKPERMASRYSRGMAAAMGGAALMVAHQVAGKAVRDSFFLSNYPASALPKMVMATAPVTIVLVLLFARVMSRYGPQRLVPGGLLLSSVLHGIEHRMMPGNPALWSVL